MSLFANAKAKAVSGNMKEAFKNEEGAIDLASIMVGIIVIGLIGGVIAATVFAVIPWAQNNAAKQQLDSVAAAQSAFIGLATDVQVRYAGATSAGVFGLVATNDIIAPSGEVLFDGTTAANLVIAGEGVGSAAHYAAAVKSSSGVTFYITDTKTQPTELAAGAAAVANAQGSGITVTAATTAAVAPTLGA